MSVEKFIVMYFPLKTRNLCTVKTAKWSCAITGIALAAFNSQFFFILENHKGDAYSVYCDYINVPDNYINIFHKIDSAIVSFAPFTIMGITNIGIIYKFIQAKLASKYGTESTNQALAKSTTRGAALLVTASLTFIILTGPASIYYSVTVHIDPLWDLGTRLPFTLNSAINCVLYCIIGSRFRSEMASVLCCTSNKGLNRTKSTLSTVSAG